MCMQVCQSNDPCTGLHAIQHIGTSPVHAFTAQRSRVPGYITISAELGWSNSEFNKQGARQGTAASQQLPHSTPKHTHLSAPMH
jgi:hypothetical protein